MTNEQMAIVIKVLQFGYAVGIANRYDALRRYCALYPTAMFYAVPAFCEFEKGCCYSAEQELEKASMTPIEFARWLWPERCVEFQGRDDIQI